ncbi:PAS domain S-box protein [Halorubrum ejinorense]|uniref:PAS domain S-box protein n=1 Tax=Halorubrum ejinorense TaxID=425309 RepID=A0AAV3ST94_9EURY
MLRVGITEPEGFDDAETATIEGIAANLRTALARIEGRRSTSDSCDLARALFDQSNEPAFVSDTDGTLVAVNRAAVELTGRDRDALLTNGLPDIAVETATGPVREHLERTVSGTPKTIVTSLEHARGGAFRVELTSRPIDVDGSTYVRTTAHGPSSKPQLSRERPADPIGHDTAALRQLNELTVNAGEFDETIGRLLSLGCETFGLDTGILSRVDGGDYEVDVVVDETGSHEAGTVYDLTDTMCDATLAGEVTGTLAFADVADSDHQDNPAAGSVSAYIAAPVVANGDTYGTVNFSMGKPRSAAFRPEEREFVKLIAQHIGTEIERRRRFAELERYETILEAVDDPVYALDTDGRFTFVNTAAEREFGYDEDVIGNHPTVGMDDSDVERMEAQIESLLTTGDRSATTEFELETADGDHKTVENRLALIGDEEFRGTAGVLRDITDRKERRRQLESFQRAIDEAADGIAILDGSEYTYVDQTHVEMYGFEAKDQLLGNTWRKLYAADEVERLEAEAFPALEADGYWRGMVTGSRPDGSTFPAELSLTIIGDGRLVCTVRDETERRARERELESFQQAVESARDGVAILDGGEYTYVDRTHVEMYGFESKERLIGQTWRELYDDDEVERLEAEAFPALEADGYWRGMVTGCRPDGSRFPAELSLTAIDDGRLVCTVRDETEQQARKRELEGRSAAIEAAKDGVAILNEDAEYTYANRAHADMYGYDGSAAFVGDSWEKCYEGPECDRLTSEALSSLTETGGWRGEAVGLRKDGTTFPQDLSLARLDDGRIVCVVRDVTERRARERELKLKERAMDEATVGIQITDATQDGNPLVYVNDGFERMTGYGRADAIGRNPRFLQGEDSDPEQVARLREAINSEEPISLELQNYREDGTPYWTRVSVAPVTDEDGVVTNYVGIQQDVTDRKEHTRWLRQFLNEGPLLFVETREVDGKAVIDSCNDQLLNRLGYDREEVEGSPLASIYTSDSASKLREEGYGRALDGEFGVSERELVGSDGKSVYALLRAVPRRDETSGTNALFVDISKRRERERQTETRVDLLERIYEVTTDPQTSFEEKIDGLLNAGQDHLDLPYGFLTRIDTGEESTASTQRIVEGVGPHELLQSGESRPLSESYCRLTIENDGATGLVNAAESELVDDAAYDTFGLETYVGGKVKVNDRVYGTLCFASSEQRERPFDEFERSLVSLLGQWAGYEIERRDAREELRQQQERLELTLSGTQTGIADWDLTDGTVQWNETLVDMIGQDIETFEEFEALVHPEDRQRVERELERMLETGEPWIGDLRLRRTDDTYLWQGVRAVPRYDDAGNPVRVLTVATDITDRKERQQQLEREREQFKLLVESIDEYAFVIVDGDGVIQTWNTGASGLFGYDSETAVGMSMGRLYPESDRDSELPDRLLQQARIAGESAHEGWQARADGSEFYADVRYAPLETDDGGFHGYAMVVHDMTDPRRQQRRTERFVEESTDVVTIVDTDGTVEYASGSADRVLGYDRDDLVGTNLFDYLHPESREDAMETFFDGVDDPGADIQAEWRIESGDGAWLNVESQCRNMLEDDAIGGMLLYLRDVTENRKRARRYESIFNQTFQFTGLLEPDGTIVEANDAALAFGEFDRSDIVGTPFQEVDWWSHSDTVRTRVRDAIRRAASGEFVRYETDVRGGNGLATIDFSVKPVTNEDGEVSLLVVEGRDVTARNQHKRHLEVMQRVMRHNMRNDLTKLRGWTELIAEETDADKRAEQFEITERILDKWVAMTEKMKQIRSVLDSRQGREPKREVGALVEAAVAPVREEYAAATVATDVPDDGPPVPVELLDAVRELVENAAKASSEAAIEVRVDHSADGWTEVLVRDDGPGMPDMEASVLETGEESQLNHGQGLGLWMVRMIVTQAGGDASVESTRDGTEVCLRLPERQTMESERSGRTVE